jgi:hypothetical protein
MVVRIVLGTLALAVTVPPFGGEPPWGRERPTRIAGEVRHGERFERPIGPGLYLRLEPYPEGGWHIEVGPARDADRSEDADDFAGCVNVPFHGTTDRDIEGWHFRNDDNTGARDRSATPGLGEKRWFDFVLTGEAKTTECDNLGRMQYSYNDPIERAKGERAWGALRSGRGWLRITGMTLGNLVRGERASIAVMTFEAEVALHGALELWKLPATFVIPDDVSGWVAIYGRRPRTPALSRAGERYMVRITRPGMIETSSEFRTDRRGARFVSTTGESLPTHGASRRIWGWDSFVEPCGALQRFFVGSRQQYESVPKNPTRASLVPKDCSALLPSPSFRE